uniref:STIL centriolar assembly protein n=1 Tax=Varanus komodoensis TaxID=61221 RepID=A0A8D2L1A0_VARKO
NIGFPTFCSPRCVELQFPSGGKMLPFSFPPSKCALWNPSPTGESTISHLSSHRNPKLIMAEKTLRLAHRHAKQSRRKPFSCFLVATLAIDEDNEGVSLTIDRFDPGREVTGSLGKIPSAPLPGDFLIPCTFNAWGSSSDDVIVHRSEDFSLAFKKLQQNLNSQDSLEPSNMLTLRVHISSTENMDNLNFDFHWAAVTIGNALKYSPVKPVPIIPTALARNLSSHINISQVQRTYKCGYLTMDQTRKLLLVLETDPKAYSLPLIGIWLSGISHIYNPQVWTCCLRFLFSSSIQERVLSESGSFLIVLYSSKHKDPEFYECLPCGGHTELCFQLLTNKETLHRFKNVEPSDRYAVQFELNSDNKNSEMEFFSQILKKISFSSPTQGSSPSKLSVSDHDSGVEDDASPRPFPHPLPVSQQMTKIQPSVPELSVVFDGVTAESIPRSKHGMIMQTKKQLSFGHQPGNITSPTEHPPCQLQSSDNGKQIFGSCSKKPSPRQLPGQLKQKNPVLKSYKGMQSPPQEQAGGVDGSSPNTSSHQLGIPSERHLASDDAMERNGKFPIAATSSSNTPIASQHLWHSCALSPQHIRPPVDFRIPVQGPLCCPSCVCNCQLCGHMQYSPTNIWQGLHKTSSSHRPEIQSGSAQESTQLICQSIECTNTGCNPVCAKNCHTNLGHHGIMGNSPFGDNVSAIVKNPSTVDSGSTQSHAVYSGCMHTTAQKMVSDNEVMGLSSDVYRILSEQDRQIKLLQAQIQRLLEAQTLQPCSTKTIANSSVQSEKQLEFVAMETQSSPGLHMKKSVSIAVSTGASLFWNSPLEKNKDYMKEDDAETSNEEISEISMNTEKNKSQTSIASSLKAVDIPSFVDSLHVAEEALCPTSAGFCAPVTKEMPQPSPLSESVSMCLQTRLSGETGHHVVAINEQNVEHVIPSLPNVPTDDQKFYKDILGQVNHFLKESSEEHSFPIKKELINSECPASSKTCKTERCLVPDPVLRDNDSVLTATLKQLRKLGINLDSTDKMNSTHKVENASIMACINPEAVVPGLNYISFANVGMSGLTPNGVDLSMEANAIALKYLSESQLSQLSLSHSSQKNSMASSVQTLLQTNTDKTLVGFGLISPSNMSFATKKYMRRYGLLQSSDGSNDDEQQTDVCKGEEDVEPVLQLDLSPVLEGFTCWKGPSEMDGERQFPYNTVQSENELSNGCLPHSESPILRNVTNTVLPPRILHQSTESSHLSLNPKMKLLYGKAEFTQHPDKENLDVQMIHETVQHPIADHLNQGNNMNSVGTFLDVQQLRQLPKLL